MASGCVRGRRRVDACTSPANVNVVGTATISSPAVAASAPCVELSDAAAGLLVSDAFMASHSASALAFSASVSSFDAEASAAAVSCLASRLRLPRRSSPPAAATSSCRSRLSASSSSSSTAPAVTGSSSPSESSPDEESSEPRARRDWRLALGERAPDGSGQSRRPPSHLLHLNRPCARQEAVQMLMLPVLQTCLVVDGGGFRRSDCICNSAKNLHTEGQKNCMLD